MYVSHRNGLPLSTGKSFLSIDKIAVAKFYKRVQHNLLPGLTKFENPSWLTGVAEVTLLKHIEKKRKTLLDLIDQTDSKQDGT